MKALKVKSELAQLEKIRSFLKTSLQGLSLSEEDYFKIELSLVEICTNIMRYAYPEEKGDILVETWLKDGTIYLEIRDEGIPFNPTHFKKPSLKEMASTEHVGGLGIFLARKLMDGFSYRRENNQNILTMYKRAEANKA